MTSAARVVTSGTLLGGRVRHDQFRDGHRTGIEPVLLAAAIPAAPGARVLEAGTGTGAALLCLAVRVAGIDGVGVESDAATAELARANVRANGADGISVETVAIESFTAGGAPFDHAMANPPWHGPAGTLSPDAARDGARRRDPHLLGRWTTRLGAALRPRGSLTLIVAASVLSECLAAFEAAGLGAVTLFPLWPKAGVAAKLILLRAVRSARGPCRVESGLTLHNADGSYTDGAGAILRDGAALSF